MKKFGSFRKICLAFVCLLTSMSLLPAFDGGLVVSAYAASSDNNTIRVIGTFAGVTFGITVTALIIMYVKRSSVRIAPGFASFVSITVSVPFAYSAGFGIGTQHIEKNAEDYLKDPTVIIISILIIGSAIAVQVFTAFWISKHTTNSYKYLVGNQYRQNLMPEEQKKLKYFIKAAEGGNTNAQAELGEHMIYTYNYRIGADYFIKASSSGRPDIGARIFQICNRMKEIPDGLVLEMLSAAAENCGDAESKGLLMQMYMQNNDLSRAEKYAFDLLQNGGLSALERNSRNLIVQWISELIKVYLHDPNDESSCVVGYELACLLKETGTVHGLGCYALTMIDDRCGHCNTGEALQNLQKLRVGTGLFFETNEEKAEILQWADEQDQTEKILTIVDDFLTEDVPQHKDLSDPNDLLSVSFPALGSFSDEALLSLVSEDTLYPQICAEIVAYLTVVRGQDRRKQYVSLCNKYSLGSFAYTYRYWRISRLMGNKNADLPLADLLMFGTADTLGIEGIRDLSVAETLITQYAGTNTTRHATLTCELEILKDFERIDRAVSEYIQEHSSTSAMDIPPVDCDIPGGAEGRYALGDVYYCIGKNENGLWAFFSAHRSAGSDIELLKKYAGSAFVCVDEGLRSDSQTNSGIAEYLLDELAPINADAAEKKALIYIDEDPGKALSFILPGQKISSWDLKKQLESILTPSMLAEYIRDKLPVSEKRLSEVPDLSAFGDGSRLYGLAFGMEKEGNQQEAIFAYAASAKQGCRKAAYTLANMAMEDTRYFIYIEDRTEAE